MTRTSITRAKPIFYTLGRMARCTSRQGTRRLEIAYDSAESWPAPYGVRSRDHREATAQVSLNARGSRRAARTMPEQQPRSQPRDAEAAVGAYAPLLREMMLDGDTKKKYGVPPASWWLFKSTKVRNPHVPRHARCVTASDFSYLTEIRAQFERGDKRRDLYIDGEEFGASAMVQSVRKEGPSGLKSKWCRQITPLTPPENDRY